VRGRHDLAEHSFVSAAIAAGAGQIPAEAAGIAREMRDSNGGSEFSFSDWAADLSGIALAEGMKTQPESGRCRSDRFFSMSLAYSALAHTAGITACNDAPLAEYWA
jgi:hypothetical protein